MLIYDGPRITHINRTDASTFELLLAGSTTFFARHSLPSSFPSPLSLYFLSLSRRRLDVDRILHEKFIRGCSNLEGRIAVDANRISTKEE